MNLYPYSKTLLNLLLQKLQERALCPISALERVLRDVCFCSSE